MASHWQQEGAEEGVLRVKRLSDDAKLPTRASAAAAGLDLYTPEDGVIEPGTRQLVDLRIQIQIPPRYYGRVAPRSGLAIKYGVTTDAGVIDPDYRGNIGVALVNNGTHPFHFKKHDRIAQLILTRFGALEVVEELGELGATARGTGGFGSTGRSTLKRQRSTTITDPVANFSESKKAKSEPGRLPLKRQRSTTITDPAANSSEAKKTKSDSEEQA